jgi:hypothetical protein
MLISRCSSGVEHFLGKEEVVSSILINGSEYCWFRDIIDLDVVLGSHRQLQGPKIPKFAIWYRNQIVKTQLKTDNDVKRDF